MKWLFGSKKSSMDSVLVNLPVPSFKEKWAIGEFDDCDYYALTAPLDEWSTEYPMHCISEEAPGITKEGWGIVTWKPVVFVYSNQDIALKRARMLGGRVEPLKLKCLSCFARAFSTFFSFVDMVLDESWHIEAFICREAYYPLNGDFRRGVSHLRLSTIDGLFQLNGCTKQNNLSWESYPEYGEPNHPPEWCRPTPFPKRVLVYDHSAQGGPVDMEMLSDAETLEYHVIDGVLIARDKSPSRNFEKLLAPALGPIAFAHLHDEKVRLTYGEGVWIPIAIFINKKWELRPWALAYKEYVEKFNQEGNRLTICKLSRDCQWHTNHTFSLLESVFLENEKSDENTKQRMLDESALLLRKAVEEKPWDWYSRTLLKDIRNLSMEELPAMIHADRIAWLTSTQNRNYIDNEYEYAISFKNQYELAKYNYSLSLRMIGFQEEGEAILNEILRINPKHPQALLDLAFVACKEGDEKKEMHLYAESAESDPLFTLPLYNMGRTYEDNNEIVSAIECYKKALKSNPYHIEVLEQLAIIRFNQGDLQDCCDLYMKLIEADPRRLKTYQNFFVLTENIEDSTYIDAAMQAFRIYLPREAAYYGFG